MSQHNDYVHSLVKKLIHGETIEYPEGEACFKVNWVNQLNPDGQEWTAGAELLFQAPSGDIGRQVSGGELLSHCRECRIDTSLHKLIAQLDLAMIGLIGKALKKHPDYERLERVKKSINLSSFLITEIINNEIIDLTPFTQIPKDFILEISETHPFDIKGISAFHTFKERLPAYKFSLDDLPVPGEDSLRRQAEIIKYLAWTKVDYLYFQDGFRSRWATLAQEIKEHLILARELGYDLVIEGIEPIGSASIDHVKKELLNIAREVDYHLLMQGYGIKWIEPPDKKREEEREYYKEIHSPFTTLIRNYYDWLGYKIEGEKDIFYAYRDKDPLGPGGGAIVGASPVINDLFLKRLKDVIDCYRNYQPRIYPVVVLPKGSPDEQINELRGKGVEIVKQKDLELGLLDTEKLTSWQKGIIERDENYPPEKYIKQKAKGSSIPVVDELYDFATSSGAGFLLLGGEFGIGKTFALRELYRRLASEYQENPEQRVPIFISLGEMERSKELTRLLDQHFRRAEIGFTDKSPDALLAMGGVLLLDALDELSLRIKPEELLELARNLTQLSGKDTKIILTCRSYLIEASSELKDTFLSRGKAIELGEFNEEEIIEFLGKYGREDPIGDCERLKENPLLWEMAKRPVFLHYFSYSFNEAIEAAKIGQKQVDVINRCIDQEIKRVIKKYSTTLSPDNIRQFDQNLALYLWRTKQVGIDEQSLKFQIVEFLPKYIPFDEATFRLINRVALLKRDTQGLWTFSHKAIQEFFLASCLKEEKDPIPLLSANLFSPEAGRFLFELLGEQKAKNLVEKLGETPGLFGKENTLILGAFLKKINLEGQDLSPIDLRGYNYNLQGANLKKAILVGKNLKGFNLREADLRGANLTGADLVGADLLGALIDGARFDYVRGWKAKTDKEMPGFGASWDREFKIEPVLEPSSYRTDEIIYSPDGRLLIAASEGGIIFFDSKINRAIRHIPSPANCIAISPDGNILASGSDDRTIRLWETETGRLIQRLEGHTSRVLSVAISPDGGMLASGAYDNTICLWETRTGRLIQRLEGHTGWVRSVAFSPDGENLASGSNDRTICLWEIRTGRLIQTLEGHKGPIFSVAFSPDGGKLASGSDDRTICLWEIRTGRLIQRLEGHTDSVFSVAFSPDGTILASGSYDNTICLWETRTARLIQRLEGHTDRVRSVAFSPDGTILASGSYDNTICLWETRTARLIQRLEGHTGRVFSVAISPDGAMLASGSDDRTICLWETKTGRLIQRLEGHTGRVFSVAISPDGAM
ncbi:MAG: pentapeptide repeat-containing protein, partial [bacterium]